MIQAKNGKQTVSETASQTRRMLESRLSEAQRLEHEVGQWIKQNPMIGLSLAVAVGIGLGLLLKRRR
jgi:ElaB/YqjD/DUF883 family membrane-anchored ribosome-binding protein